MDCSQAPPLSMPQSTGSGRRRAALARKWRHLLCLGCSSDTGTQQQAAVIMPPQKAHSTPSSYSFGTSTPHKGMHSCYSGHSCYSYSTGKSQVQRPSPTGCSGGGAAAVAAAERAVAMAAQQRLQRVPAAVAPRSTARKEIQRPGQAIAARYAPPRTADATAVATGRHRSAEPTTTAATPAAHTNLSSSASPAAAAVGTFPATPERSPHQQDGAASGCWLHATPRRKPSVTISLQGSPSPASRASQDRPCEASPSPTRAGSEGGSRIAAIIRRFAGPSLDHGSPSAALARTVSEQGTPALTVAVPSRQLVLSPGSTAKSIAAEALAAACGSTGPPTPAACGGGSAQGTQPDLADDDGGGSSSASMTWSRFGAAPPRDQQQQGADPAPVTSSRCDQYAQFLTTSHGFKYGMMDEHDVLLLSRLRLRGAQAGGMDASTAPMGLLGSSPAGGGLYCSAERGHGTPPRRLAAAQERARNNPALEQEAARQGPAATGSIGGARARARTWSQPDLAAAMPGPDGAPPQQWEQPLHLLCGRPAVGPTAAAAGAGTPVRQQQQGASGTHAPASIGARRRLSAWRSIGSRFARSASAAAVGVLARNSQVADPPVGELLVTAESCYAAGTAGAGASVACSPTTAPRQAEASCYDPRVSAAAASAPSLGAVARSIASMLAPGSAVSLSQAHVGQSSGTHTPAAVVAGAAWPLEHQHGSARSPAQPPAKQRGDSAGAARRDIVQPTTSASASAAVPLAAAAAARQDGCEQGAATYAMPAAVGAGWPAAAAAGKAATAIKKASSAACLSQAPCSSSILHPAPQQQQQPGPVQPSAATGSGWVMNTQSTCVPVSVSGFALCSRSSAHERVSATSLGSATSWHETLKALQSQVVDPGSVGAAAASGAGCSAASPLYNGKGGRSSCSHKARCSGLVGARPPHQQQHAGGKPAPGRTAIWCSARFRSAALLPVAPPAPARAGGAATADAHGFSTAGSGAGAAAGPSLSARSALGSLQGTLAAGGGAAEAAAALAAAAAAGGAPGSERSALASREQGTRARLLQYAYAQDLL